MCSADFINDITYDHSHQAQAHMDANFTSGQGSYGKVIALVVCLFFQGMGVPKKVTQEWVKAHSYQAQAEDASKMDHFVFEM